jgi:multisubunit Na+/H+ antiporter MnhC subunit
MITHSHRASTARAVNLLPDTLPGGPSAFPSVSARSRVWLVAFAAYATLSVAFLWPVAVHLSSAFPHDALDPAFTTWVLWWNAHAVPLTARWWNGPMFWPVPGTMTFSEHLLGISLLTTPLQWAGLTPVAAANIAVLVSFPLCAIGAHALAFAITERHDAAAIAALVFGFSPYRVSQLPHVQMLWTFGLPLVLVAGHRYVTLGDRRWLAAFGAAWLLQALSNGHFLLFFPVLLVCWLLWFGRDRGAWRAIGGVWLAASLPLLPFVLVYEREHARLGLERTLGEILRYSADVTGLFAASPNLLLWGVLAKWSRSEGELFPGTLALLLATAGAVAGVLRARRAILLSASMRKAQIGLALATTAVLLVAVSPAVAGPWRLGQVVSVSSAAKPLTIALVLAALAIGASPPVIAAWRSRSPAGFYTGATVLMFVLSLGPYPRLAGHQVLFRAPYSWLMELPGFGSIRVPGRFGMLFVLCLSVAAACAFASLTARLPRRSRRIFAAVAATVVLIESWPAAPVAAVPRSTAVLNSSTDPVVELPLGRIDRDIAALYHAMVHGQPIVNGYSGFFPPHYVVLDIALRDGDLDALAAVAAGGSLTVAIDRHVEFEQWAGALTARQALLLASDGDEYVFRLAGAGPDPIVEGEPLPIQAIDASEAKERVAAMIDADYSTVWATPGPQRGGETLLVDLGREREVTAVRMDFGALAGDVPRALTVECASERGGWQACWRGSALAAAVRGALREPRRLPMVLPIDRSGVRRLRLRNTAADSHRPWSIAELIVLGR